MDEGATSNPRDLYGEAVMEEMISGSAVESVSSPHRISPHLTAAHPNSPHLISPHPASPHLTHLTPHHLTPPHPSSPSKLDPESEAAKRRSAVPSFDPRASAVLDLLLHQERGGRKV